MSFKGSLSLLILHILAGAPRHGYGIAQEIKAESEGVLDYKEGSLYPTLHSMEKQGLIEGYKEKRGGRMRRYYRLTKAGRAQLSKERAEWEAYSRAVNLVLGEDPA